MASNEALLCRVFPYWGNDIKGTDQILFVQFNSFTKKYKILYDNEEKQPEASYTTRTFQKCFIIPFLPQFKGISWFYHTNICSSFFFFLFFFLSMLFFMSLLLHLSCFLFMCTPANSNSEQALLPKQFGFLSRFRTVFWGNRTRQCFGFANC